MAATEQWISFAVKQAWMSAWSAGVAASWTEIELARDSTVNIGITEAEVADGEGKLIHVFFHTQRCEGTLMCGKTALRALELATGNATSSVSGGEFIYMGTDEEITPPYCRFKFAATAIDDTDAEEGYVLLYVLKAQARLEAVGFAETTPGEFSLAFKGLRGTTDEAGNTIPEAILKYGGIYATTADVT